MNRRTLWITLGCWLALAVVGLVPGRAAAQDLFPVDDQATLANCLMQDGAPFEEGGNVCIKVKNTCDHVVAVNWKVKTYNFGVQATPVGTAGMGTVAVDANSSTKVCAKKPAAAGTYCFRFCIQNFDQTQPDDGFSDWLNNIKVAAIRGGVKKGNMVIGGSGLVDHDLVLVQENPPLPRGWRLGLSRTSIPASSFPATVIYSITAPPSAPFGEQATFVVAAYDTVTGDRVGDATISAYLDVVPATTATAGVEVAEKASGLDAIDPVPVEFEPAPHLLYPEAERERPVSGTTLLVAWDSNATEVVAEPNAKFEYLGSDGWVAISGAASRPANQEIGLAAALWDTTDLPSGDYLVRVTWTNRAGLSGTDQRVIPVRKAPQAIADGVLLGTSLFADASASTDPDSPITRWDWNFGDGTTASGPSVSHDFATTTGSYTVSVTTTDSTGLENTEYCEANLDDVTFVCAEVSCGCVKMDIKGAGEGPGTTPLPSLPPGHKTDLGPINTLGAGAGPHAFRYGFEVTAELQGDPSKCDWHQWVKGEGWVGGNTYPKTDGDGNTYPSGGSSYGDDGYGPGNPYGGVSGTPPKVHWNDAPGLPDLPPGALAGSGAAGAGFKAHFFAMVTGPLGTCTCTWDIDMAVAANGVVVTPPVMSNEKCTP
ncbi:MAG: PKD domain-containing protein [Thermoanaerobaculia bacterium]